jgi:hypothetical protein
MTYDEFYIGDNCRHYIIAAEITDSVRRDPSWLNGPPLAVAVVALDAYDIQVCSKERRNWNY